MRLGGFDGLFFRTCEFISKIAYANVLWFLFMVLGLGIFGIAPATVALFAVNRKWVMGENDVPIFQTFWKVYKKEFVKANLLGLIVFLAGYIIYVDLAYFPPTNMVSVIIRYIIIAVGVMFIVTTIYVFPVYVHYNGNIKSYIKFAFLFAFSYPLFTFAIIIGVMIIYTLLSLVPGVIPFFGICVVSYFTSWIAMQVFNRVQAKSIFTLAEEQT